jgi:beta-lactamase regulating signal transducer with metallopeptidase domain
MNAELDLLSHTALKGSAVLLAALVVGWAWRRLAASRRYALWMTAMLALAVLPFAMLSLPAWRVIPKDTPAPDWMVMESQDIFETVQEPVKVSQVAEPVIQTKAVAVQSAPQEPAKPFWTWEMMAEALPKIWLGVVALMLVRLLWSAVRLSRLQKHLPEGECEELEAVARELGLKQAPRLLIGAVDAVPMVWGVWRPCLLLPAGFESWSLEKRRGVLLHELAHLRRRDPLALWLAQAVKVLHWFNPLAWLTLRQMRADQERACDDTVLRHGVKPSDYAQSLLDLSRHSRVAPGLALCALTITRCAPVEARVKAVLDARCARDPLTLRWLTGVSALALLMLLPVAMLHAIEGPKLRGRIMDRHGVVLAETTRETSRRYPLKSLAAHLIGYTRVTSSNDATPIGHTEIEKTQDEVLERGDDVRLTLDMRVQALAHRAMVDAGYERGAAVVLDPRSGEILAMVSLPAHDPNLFIPSISHPNWDKLAADRDNPLMNRCVRGFTPGSSMKPLIGLAGIAAGIGNRNFTCEGSVKYGSAEMQCWIKRQNGGQHGVLNLAGALTASCNCFFYQFGNAAGIDQIENMGRTVGFGTRYGISENESPGILPSPRWLKENAPSETWSAGYTANASIGQGATLASPLQMAVLAATLANGGKVPEPSLQPKNGKNTWRADLIAEGLPAAQIEQLREGMRQVVHGENGTAKTARSEKVVIAGKTGTAQNWRRIDGIKVEDNHAWFIGFAPYEKPTLAFAILKNGGKSGGGDCAPIAKRIVEEALALPADGSGEVEPVESKKKAGSATTVTFPLRFDGETIRKEVQNAEQQSGDGLKLTKVNTSALNSWVQIEGEASGMIQALAFRDKVIETGKRHDIEWTFPVPETMPDGVRVRFVIRGEPRSMIQRRKANAELLSLTLSKINDTESRAMSRWRLLQLAAKLPGLPASASPELEDHQYVVSSLMDYRFVFSAPAADALSWLKECLKQTSSTVSRWPGDNESFDISCQCGPCQIRCVAVDGKLATVVISGKLTELLPSQPGFRRPPEGPTIPKNLPEERKPKIDRTVSVPEYFSGSVWSPLNLPSPSLPSRTPQHGTFRCRLWGEMRSWKALKTLLKV